MVEPPVATSAVVVPAEVNLVALQERAGFEATIRDQNGQVMQGAPVTWSTSDPSVVTVDPTGTAVSVGNGRAQVAAASGTAMASASVLVAQRGAVVEVDWGGSRLLLGDSVQATLPVANDPNGHRVAPARIAWTTSDPAIATVDPNGWVRTVGPGHVRIEVDVGGFVTAQDYSVELDRVSRSRPDPATGRPRHRRPSQHRSAHRHSRNRRPSHRLRARRGLRSVPLPRHRSDPGHHRRAPLSGPVLEFWVPHRPFLAQYRVELLQVAGEDYALRDLAGYSALISP